MERINGGLQYNGGKYFTYLEVTLSLKLFLCLSRCAGSIEIFLIAYPKVALEYFRLPLSVDLCWSASAVQPLQQKLVRDLCYHS